MPSYQDNKRGIIALTTGCALFTVNDTITKITALTYGIGEVLVIRGLICLVILGAALFAIQRTLIIHGALQNTVLLRAGLDGLANIAFVTALTKLRLADLIAINLMSPLIVTMLLAFFFKEQVGWRRWSAISVGVAGMLLIVKPSPANFNEWALVALAGACCSATRDIVTRRIQPGTSTLAVTFVSMMATTIAGSLYGVLAAEEWKALAPHSVGLLLLASVFLTAGSAFAVAAFRNVDLTLVAPFRYSLLIWSGLSGYFVFGEISDRLSVAGTLLIVASGLYTLHRERVRQRDIASSSAVR
ncbi:MAG: DMT family transporter [Proteobacteria bacterium]|nr:DMT family transporter [Pseudomonadota bacterium]